MVNLCRNRYCLSYISCTALAVVMGSSLPTIRVEAQTSIPRRQISNSAVKVIPRNSTSPRISPKVISPKVTDSTSPALPDIPSRDPKPSAPVTAPVGNPQDEFKAASDYLLGPGDEVDIRVFGYDEYTGTQLVLPDGSITLPVVGRMTAAGQTPALLAQNITTQLQPLLVEPVVTVRVSRLRPLLINIAGEVQRPGPIQLRALTGEGTTSATGESVVTAGSIPTVSTAIASAGGITKNADVRKVLLKRQRLSGETVSVKLNLWEAVRSSDTTSDIILRDGDTLFIPKATEATEIDPKLLSRSTLAPKTVRITVFGEVKSPGEHQVAPNSTISKAVGVAGGPTKEANLAAVAYVRLNENGTIVKQGLDLSNLSDSVQVQEGDVVIVPRTDVATFGDILQTATSILNPLLLFRILQ
jgi:polysaccharide biosynthesis/export protein